MATSSKTVLGHLVQISMDFSSWTTDTSLECQSCSEGSGQTVGEVNILRYMGVVRLPGETGSPSAVSPYTGYLGNYCRVLIQDAGGGITVDTVKYTALWYGILESESRTDSGGGVGSQVFRGIGLVGSLARVRLGQGWIEARGASSTVASYLDRVPAFNTPVVGGRSASTYTIDGKAIYIFNQGSGDQWTAKQILDNLLTTHGRVYVLGTGFVGGITWTLSAGTLLDFKPDALDLCGMTLLDALNTLINPRRGLTYRVTVSGTTATITALSVSAVAINITHDAGSYSLAAATATATPVLTDVFIQDVTYTEDQSETYDQIKVVGARPWIAVTLAYDPTNATTEAKSLEALWAAGDETAWANGTTPGSTTTEVWRTFKIPATWDGRTYGGSVNGVRQSLFVDANDDYTGSRIYDSVTDFPPTAMELTSDLPYSPGATPTDPTGARVESMVFYLPAGESNWKTCTGQSELEASPSLPRSLSVWSAPCYIRIGNVGSEQVDNKYAFSGGKVLATVGIREPDPLIMTWTRDSADWPRTTPRVMYFQATNCEQWVICPACVIGVDSSGDLVAQADATNADAAEKETFIRDDRPQLRAILAFLRAYYTTPARALSWTNTGTIDTSYAAGSAAPGSLVTSATLGTGAVTINAVVTSRSWDLTEKNYGTSYSTARVVPDIEALR